MNITSLNIYIDTYTNISNIEKIIYVLFNNNNQVKKKKNHWYD